MNPNMNANTNLYQFGQVTNELSLVNRVVVLGPLSYKVGDFVIPGDKKLFNQMWINKEFDKINTRHFNRDLPTLYRGNNCALSWDETFFNERKKLQHMTAAKMWETSIYPTRLKAEIYKILHTSNPLEGLDFHYVSPEAEQMVQNYLSAAPETLMFTENMPFAYENPIILPIYRDLIARFQLLGNRTNDERTSIYLQELESVGNKIRFIQTLCYYGLKRVIIRFKILKNNDLDHDPEMAEIMAEPTSHLGFWKTGFKKALYDFYSLCASPEKVNEDNKNRMYLISTTIKHYEKIKRLISCYLLPMRSCIRQVKLHTISCQVIFSYLGPSFIAAQYIVTLLN
jgi:hypothetical protein